MAELKLGKRPATEDTRDLLFARYVEPAKLPTPPAQFGHETLFKPKSWGMLGNDEWGDCARYEDLACAGQVAHSFGDAHRQAGDVIAADLDFAGVYSCPQIQPDVLGTGQDLGGTA